MTKIVQVPFSKVPKLEFPELVNNVVMVVSKHNPDQYNIRNFYDFLLEAQSQNSKLSASKRKTEESIELQTLKKKRYTVLSAIIGQTKNLEKVNLPEHANALSTVSVFIDGFFGKIRKDVSKIKTERVKQLFVQLDSNMNLQMAMQNVGLTPYLNELRGIQLNIDAKSAKNIEQNAARPKLKDTREVIAKMKLALTNLFRGIEFGVHAHPNVDYTPLINELNELLTKYRSEIKAKATRIKNAAQADVATKSNNEKAA